MLDMLCPIRPYPLTTRALLKQPVSQRRMRELREEQHARRLFDMAHQAKNSGVTGTWSELLFSNTSDYAAFSNSASEGSLLSPGPKMQPVIPALFFDANKAFGRSIMIEAQGILSNTGTPTIIFNVRFGTSQGATQLGGTLMSVSVAITTTSGVTNQWWYLRFMVTLNTPGQGSGNATLSGAGQVTSPGGFASPFIYPMEPSTPPTGTWTATIDNTATQYVNLSVQWGAASSSNTITCKQLWMWGLN